MYCFASRRSAVLVCLLLSAQLGCDRAEPTPPPLDRYSREALNTRWGVDAPADDVSLAFYSRELDERPCDAEIAYKLGLWLMQKYRPTAAIAHLDQVLTTCPQSLQLIELRVEARMKARQWDAALADCDAALAVNPDDDWLWSMRAQIGVGRRDPLQALLDLEQGLALTPRLEEARIAMDLVDQATSQRCAIAFVLRPLVSIDTRDRRLTRRVRELHEDGGCHAQLGEGSDHIAFADGITLLAAQVGDASVDLALDTNLGVTVLTRATAQRAGIPLAGQSVNVYIVDGHRTGTLALAPSVTIGETHVASLPVVVVDTLPNGWAGVLGHNYLARFDTVTIDRGVRLKPWPTEVGPR